MVYTTYFGFAEDGDLTLFLTGWDADGNGCGYSNSTKSHGLLYWPAIDYRQMGGKGVSDIRGVLKMGVCVDKCPTGK
jgi:hypothetical protein